MPGCCHVAQQLGGMLAFKQQAPDFPFHFTSACHAMVLCRFAGQYQVNVRPLYEMLVDYRAQLACEAVPLLLTLYCALFCMQDLVGNTKANMQLLYNKLMDGQHIPDVAADCTKVAQAWLQEIFLRRPELDAANNASSSGGSNHLWQQQPQLDVHVTGHSLGGLLAEVVTVESCSFAAAHGITWRCTSFESPGLPELYHSAALRQAPKLYWDSIMTSYLAAPNAINMLYQHLGSVVHVVVPWEQTWSHVAKCVGADIARVTAWAIVGGMVVSTMQRLPVLAAPVRQQADNEELQGPRILTGAPTGLGLRLPLPIRQQQQGRGAVPGALAAQQCNVQAAPLASVDQISSATAPAAALAGPAVPEMFTVAAANGGFWLLSHISGGMCPSGGVAQSIFQAAVAAAMSAATGPTSGTSSRQYSNAASIAITAAAPTSGLVQTAAAAGEAAASAGGATLLQHVARRTGLGVLFNTMGGWLFGRGGIWGVMECLAGVLGVEVEELIAQHALSLMRQCFDPHTGDLKQRYRRDMASWPHLGNERGEVLLTAAKQVAKWTLPSFVCHDNMGIANVLSRTAMVEARCARLAGYVVQADIQGKDVLMTDAVADSAGSLQVWPGHQQVIMPTALADPAAAAAAPCMQTGYHQPQHVAVTQLDPPPQLAAAGDGQQRQQQQQQDALMAEIADDEALMQPEGPLRWPAVSADLVQSGSQAVIAHTFEGFGVSAAAGLATTAHPLIRIVEAPQEQQLVRASAGLLPAGNGVDRQLVSCGAGAAQQQQRPQRQLELAGTRMGTGRQLMLGMS
eukprot:GHRR01005444.1.p1 GENE.GHRR01005444.1~~GHRR01005444.1.p1  ORF type:complete len:797 (+),score=305.13 GHRR01005444.1:841-3231(+)